MIFFCANWFLARYGRPAMIFAAYASPMPGNAFSSASDAVLISSNPAAAGVLFLAGSLFFAGAFFAG